MLNQFNQIGIFTDNVLKEANVDKNRLKKEIFSVLKFIIFYFLPLTRYECNPDKVLIIRSIKFAHS